jgi:5-methylcytosine-specific restriction endonuclease McrA
LEAAQVRAGLCRPHTNEERRRYYATDPAFRGKQLAKTWRKRGLDPIPREAQEMILEEFDGKCAYCRTNVADTWDHIVAVANGGRTTPGNVVPACRSCNSAKSNRDVTEWMEERGIIVSDAFMARETLSYCGFYG